MCWEKRAHAAWDAADRAKRQTVIAAVAREQAEKAAEDALTQALHDAKLIGKGRHLLLVSPNLQKAIVKKRSFLRKKMGRALLRAFKKKKFVQKAHYHIATHQRVKEVITVALITATVLGGIRTSLRRITRSWDNGCNLSYTECFYERKLISFTNKTPIDMVQFNALVEAVADDIHRQDQGIPLFCSDPRRLFYDTPFWNGSQPDSLVCFPSGECYPQSAVNYFAQGMWSKACGESLQEAFSRGEQWNESNYSHGMTSDERYWMEYGYKKYEQIIGGQPDE